MKITKGYLERELIRLEKRYHNSDFSNDRISLSGSIFTIRKLLDKIKE